MVRSQPLSGSRSVTMYTNPLRAWRSHFIHFGLLWMGKACRMLGSWCCYFRLCYRLAYPLRPSRHRVRLLVPRYPAVSGTQVRVSGAVAIFVCSSASIYERAGWDDNWLALSTWITPWLPSATCLTHTRHLYAYRPRKEPSLLVAPAATPPTLLLSENSYT